jgi:OFA family oxalate/formate antiporter-like MFS transporter
MKKPVKRWVVLFSGIFMQTILGGIYAWSTLTPWLKESYGVTNAQSGFIFGTTIGVFTLVMLYTGHLLNIKGPKVTAGIGSFLYMAGYFLSSFSNGSFPILLLTIGIISGSGIAFGYVCPLSVSMKWFPKRKGLVTGLAVGGFGAGAIIFSSLIEYFKLSGLSIEVFMRGYAYATGVLLFILAMLLDTPSEKSIVHREPIGRLWFNRAMRINLLGMFSGTFAGLLVIGNLAPYVISRGIPEYWAVVSVTIFSIGNAFGRIVWGHIFDRLGQLSIPISLWLFAFVALAMVFPLPLYVLLGALFLLGIAFGANFVLYAGNISHQFGILNFSRLYPICFLAYGIAGIIAPGVGGYIVDTTGSYDLAMYLCIALVSVSGLFMFLRFRKASE